MYGSHCNLLYSKYSSKPVNLGPDVMSKKHGWTFSRLGFRCKINVQLQSTNKTTVIATFFRVLAQNSKKQFSWQLVELLVTLLLLEVKVIFAVVKQLSSWKESPDVFLGFLCNCEDHFHFYPLSAVHIYDLYHMHCNLTINVLINLLFLQIVHQTEL